MTETPNTPRVRWEINPYDPDGFTLSPAWARVAPRLTVKTKPSNPPRGLDPLTTRRQHTRKFRRRIVREVYHVNPDDPTILLPCEFCHDQRPWQALTSEHMRPLRAGGTNAMSNMRLSCDVCNNRRDRHFRSCGRCQQPGDVCLRGFVFQLPRRSCSRGYECPIAPSSVYGLRHRLRFDLRAMIRSGRRIVLVSTRVAGSRTFTLPENWNARTP